MNRRLLPAFLAAGALWAGAVGAHGAGSCGMPTTHCTITDERLNEISGIAMSRTNPGLFYVHNDSGDTARFFAVDAQGKVRATIRLAGVAAVDWEDIAVAPNAERVSTIYIGDIGDTPRKRSEAVIYAVPEPKIAPDGEPKTMEVTPRILRFKYPDGPRDAETLMADPAGRALYVVAKMWDGSPSGIYRLEPKWDGPVQTAVKVASVTFSDLLPIYPNMSTGGDISPDGSRVVVRTYQQAYEWRVPKGKSLDDTLKTAPTAHALALEPQGEAICYGLDNKTLFTTTENLPAPVRKYVWTEGK